MGSRLGTSEPGGDAGPACLRVGPAGDGSAGPVPRCPPWRLWASRAVSRKAPRGTGAEGCPLRGGEPLACRAAVRHGPRETPQEPRAHRRGDRLPLLPVMPWKAATQRGHRGDTLGPAWGVGEAPEGDRCRAEQAGGCPSGRAGPWPDVLLPSAGERGGAADARGQGARAAHTCEPWPSQVFTSVRAGWARGGSPW